MAADPHEPERSCGAFDESELQRKLDATFGPAAKKGVVVAVSHAGRRAYAAVGGERDAADEAGRRPLPTGCVTKLFVGALIAAEADRGALDYDDAAANLLGTAHRAVLAGTTIRHLLEHTHGLDDAALAGAPRRDGGLIDADTLLSLLSTQRFASPGALYSYSSAGAWLLAAVLERIHRQPFERLLRERVLDTLGLRELRSDSPRVPGPADTICPSVGGGLALSARDLLTFLESQAAAWRARGAPGDGRFEVTPLPGWNALEKGVRLGWKYHGEGWLGHHSIWPRASLMVRIDPRQRIAIVVASEHHPAPVVAAKLFAKVLPEYKQLAFPKPLSPQRAAALNPAPYRGRYASAAEHYIVAIDSEGAPALRLSGASLDAPLTPAAGDAFFVRGSQCQPAFVQFLDETESGFRYLWDGRRVFPRRAKPE